MSTSLLGERRILSTKPLGLRKSLKADTGAGVDWKSTPGGLIFKNNGPNTRRFWLRGKDLGSNKVAFLVKAIKGNVIIGANFGFGTDLTVEEGQTKFFRSMSSGITEPPGKTIDPTPGSPFARIDGTDLNFLMGVGHETKVIFGAVRFVPIDRRSVIPFVQ